MDEQFGPEQFVTAQMMRLDVSSGLLEWSTLATRAPAGTRSPGERSAGSTEHGAPADQFVTIGAERAERGGRQPSR
jgi:hypothetical protein